MRLDKGQLWYIQWTETVTNSKNRGVPTAVFTYFEMAVDKSLFYFNVIFRMSA